MLTRVEHYLHYMPDRLKLLKQMWDEVEIDGNYYYYY